MYFFLSNNEIKIVKNEEKYSYNIECKQPSKSLVLSITTQHLILGSTITDNYKTVTFKATTIQTLPEFQKRNNSKIFHHDLILKMILSLSKQLQYLLTKTNECFLKYDPNNIVVIDDEIFLYLSTEDLVKREKEVLHIITPFTTKGSYISPELSNIKYIPETINYRTIYYSLALLIMDCTKEEEEEGSILIKEDEIIEKLRKNIGETKLFYFLKRCFHKEIKKRMLLYI